MKLNFYPYSGSKKRIQRNIRLDSNDKQKENEYIEFLLKNNPIVKSSKAYQSFLQRAKHQ